MRTLAIDLGDKRVGLAISDEGGTLATPADVLAVWSSEDAINKILPIISDEAIRRIVLGVPLNMDGTVGPAARRAIAWGNDLSACASVPVVFVDERLSSFAAEQELADRRRAGERLTRKRKKRQLDAVAAAGFLQEFLDGKLPALTP
jgi:putative Holliday junction resolvase